MVIATQYDVNITGIPNTLPEVIHVSYDLWKLEITLIFPDQPIPVYVSFSSIGFRILDEGDLLDYWDDESRVSGWIWRINSGGWFDQESERGGFLQGQLAKVGYERPHEYLILGINDCVSVFSRGEPQISMAE